MCVDRGTLYYVVTESEGSLDEFQCLDEKSGVQDGIQEVSMSDSGVGGGGNEDSLKESLDDLE